MDIIIIVIIQKKNLGSSNNYIYCYEKNVSNLKQYPKKMLKGKTCHNWSDLW